MVPGDREWGPQGVIHAGHGSWVPSDASDEELCPHLHRTP